jgi:hypothetical protein
MTHVAIASRPWWRRMRISWSHEHPADTMLPAVGIDEDGHLGIALGDRRVADGSAPMKPTDPSSTSATSAAGPAAGRRSPRRQACSRSASTGSWGVIGDEAVERLPRGADMDRRHRRGIASSAGRRWTGPPAQGVIVVLRYGFETDHRASAAMDVMGGPARKRTGRTAGRYHNSRDRRQAPGGGGPPSPTDSAPAYKGAPTGP